MILTMNTFQSAVEVSGEYKTLDGYEREAIWRGFAFQLCQEKEAYYYSLASTLTITTLFKPVPGSKNE